MTIDLLMSLDILKNVVSPYLRILKDGMKEEVFQSFKVLICKSRTDIFMNPPFSWLYCKFSETVLKYFAPMGFYFMFSLAKQVQILCFCTKKLLAIKFRRLKMVCPKGN